MSLFTTSKKLELLYNISRNIKARFIKTPTTITIEYTDGVEESFVEIKRGTQTAKDFLIKYGKVTMATTLEDGSIGNMYYGEEPITWEDIYFSQKEVESIAIGYEF